MDQKRNPFFFSGMVQRPEDFYGRQAELQRIFGLLGGVQPMSVSVVGARRIGKSSLLWYICQTGQERLGKEWHFGYVDLFSLGELTSQRVLAEMARSLGEELPEAEASYDGFRNLIDRLVGQGRRLVICLDVFEAATEQLGSDFFGFLRGLISRNRLALVVSTETPLDQLSIDSSKTSPFPNVFAKVELRPMPDDEARELLTQRGKLSKFSDTDIKAAIRRAHGHPFVLQQLGYRLYEKHYGGGAAPFVPTKPGIPLTRYFLEWATVGYGLAFFFSLLAGFLHAPWSFVGYVISILLALVASIFLARYMLSRV
jgi:hypothetical protein